MVFGLLLVMLAFLLLVMLAFFLGAWAASVGCGV